MVDSDAGNLKAKVFFVWGTTCGIAAIFAYFCIPETKGLSLEQVDRMLEETNPRNSAKWVPSERFARGSEGLGNGVEKEKLGVSTGSADGIVEHREDQSLPSPV